MNAKHFIVFFTLLLASHSAQAVITILVRFQHKDTGQRIVLLGDYHTDTKPEVDRAQVEVVLAALKNREKTVARKLEVLIETRNSFYPSTGQMAVVHNQSCLDVLSMVESSEWPNTAFKNIEERVCSGVGADLLSIHFLDFAQDSYFVVNNHHIPVHWLTLKHVLDDREHLLSLCRSYYPVFKNYNLGESFFKFLAMSHEGFALLDGILAKHPTDLSTTILEFGYQADRFTQYDSLWGAREHIMSAFILMTSSLLDLIVCKQLLTSVNDQLVIMGSLHVKRIQHLLRTSDLYCEELEIDLDNTAFDPSYLQKLLSNQLATGQASVVV